ncbi:MAG: hypothetical protein JXM73_23410 [Anaerolineae bacterium]|nr:hypothetical protein [Anaerolineae bacterium]
MYLAAIGGLVCACGPARDATPNTLPVVRYQDTALGFAVDYPADWQVSGSTAQSDPTMRLWHVVEFLSELNAHGEQAFPTYSVKVAVGEPAGATLTETVAASLAPVAPSLRDQIETRCCLEVGGEQAMQVVNHLTRWTSRQVVVLHSGHEYNLTFHPLVGLDLESAADNTARAAFERFLDTFTFIPITTTPPVTPAVTLTPTPPTFRSEQYHLTVDLPPGWAAAEGPQLLAKLFEGLVAFNSWGQPGFWASQVATQTADGTSYRYDRESVLAQIHDGGAYVVLIQVEGPGGIDAAYGPEYERQDLGGLSPDTGAEFCKWGRRLRLEAYRGPHATAETSAALDAVLASFRFDRVPAGDPGWAIVETRKLLPAEVDPSAFPLRDGRSVWEEDTVRSVRTEVVDEADRSHPTVLVTFTYRWDTPATGELPDDCPAERCHWWRFAARPDGEVLLVEQGGANLPAPLRDGE